MKNSIVPQPTIFNGSKIMYMKVGRGLNIRLLDSLNSLPMPLASLPKTFGLEELKKGFFPHLYNTQENQDVILDKLPDQKYYDPDGMNKDKREEFLKWHEKNKDKNFTFQKEMKEYCISDVDILLKACWKFRNLLKSVTGEEVQVVDPENATVTTVLENAVDPFSFLTIASVCLGNLQIKIFTRILVCFDF